MLLKLGFLLALLLLTVYFLCKKRKVLGLVTFAVFLGSLAWFYVQDKKSQELMFRFMDDEANIEAHPELYCGKGLVLPDEYDRMGTRFECLKKGFGIGMGMPEDDRNASIARAAARPPPAEPRRLYCGNEPLPPAGQGYTGIGTRFECMQKGVGAGMRQPFSKRMEFQAKPIRPLSKKEIMDLASRLGITTEDKTRADVLALISARL